MEGKMSSSEAGTSMALFSKEQNRPQGGAEAN